MFTNHVNIFTVLRLISRSASTFEHVYKSTGKRLIFFQLVVNIFFPLFYACLKDVKLKSVNISPISANFHVYTFQKNHLQPRLQSGLKYVYKLNIWLYFTGIFNGNSQKTVCVCHLRIIHKRYPGMKGTEHRV